MKSLRLAFCLMRVPRLFISLFLFPILLSVILVYGQLLVTALMMMTLGQDSNKTQGHFQHRKQSDLGRRLILGDRELPEVATVCRWIKSASESAVISELPPSKACNPDRLDIALQVENPDTFDPSSYLRLFSGLTERLHLCRSCTPDAIVKIDSSGVRSDAYSAQAIILLRLTLQNEATQEKFLEAMRSLDQSRELLGDVHLHSAGLRTPLNTSRMEATLALAFNISALVITVLWLALKAHRRVLDYFSRSGALLPMVAATGKNTFYTAIWILTALRVATFLCAAIPIAYVGLTSLMGQEEITTDLTMKNYEYVIWITTLFLSLSLATLIASISDLKQRHMFLSIAYKFIPVSLCLLGSFIWLASFLFDGNIFGALRMIITSIPIIGMGPILVAPALQPQNSVLVIHAIFTFLALMYVAKKNGRWFAAHVEEL